MRSATKGICQMDHGVHSQPNNPKGAVIIADNMYQDNQRGSISDKIDPAKRDGFSNPPPKRGAFWLCFISAFLLTVLAFVGSIAYNATQTSLFQAAVNRYVVGQGLVSQRDADAFVKDPWRT